MCAPLSFNSLSSLLDSLMLKRTLAAILGSRYKFGTAHLLEAILLLLVMPENSCCCCYLFIIYYEDRSVSGVGPIDPSWWDWETSSMREIALSMFKRVTPMPFLWGSLSWFGAFFLGFTELYRFLLSNSMFASIGSALAFLAKFARPLGSPYDELLLKL
jgi:hypothetical protein